MRERILIVDDDSSIRDGCDQVLSRRGYDVSQASSGEEALALFDHYGFDLVMLDLKMPDVNGLDLLKIIREKDSLVPVVMITAYGTIENAVEAMRLGANDFLSKPFEPDELLMVVQRTLKARQLALENIYLKEELRRKEGEVEIIGRSSAINRVLEQASRVAPTDSTVLITGESGTGKGLLARRIHELSGRRDHSFVSVDCSTLVPSLFESELFGHSKGAFTGAGEAKIGKFELANNGTLFLDEIANINLELQAKLLKVVEEKEFSRVGSNRVTKVDVRIIAATNQDMRQAVREGRFREDLFFRLNVVALQTPPLRERREDIPLLAGYFLTRFAGKYDRPSLVLGGRALELMNDYQWPGNVRELENMMERVVIFAAGDTIEEDDLTMAGLQVEREEKPSRPGTDLGSLEEVERAHVMKVLEMTKGNRTEAASILGIDRKTLWQKIKRWGLG